jgi:hypothetical protein
MRHWGFAWIALALSLAAHVADEAAGGFLDFYNPVAQSVRERLGLPFPPVFRFDAWLAGLVVGIGLLLALSVGAFRGWRAMRPASYALAGLMALNGLAHLTLSLLSGRVIPGTVTSPLLLASAAYLIWAAGQSRSGSAAHRAP